MLDAIPLPFGRARANPLVGEARQRQRRRRLLLAAGIAVSAVVAAALVVPSTEWGVPFSGLHTPEGDLIRQDVTATIREFDNALVTGDYARACSLLDPISGQSVLRRATNPVGIHGSCETRLSGVARLVGRRQLDELKTARIYAIQYGGPETRGFAAQAFFNVLDTSWAGGVPAVGLGKNDGHASVLIQCPPLICAQHSLQNYITLNKALKGH
jgi:hypothetical protein